MSQFNRCLAFAVVFAVGCASVPDEAADRAIAQTAEATAAAVTPAEPSPQNVIEVSESDLVPINRITCRQMLQPGSNVIVTRCMSQDDWKRYERLQASRAQEIVRMLRGDTYR